MYVLSLVDEINDSFGATSLTDGINVLRYSNSVKKLKDFVYSEYDEDNCTKTKWVKNKGFPNRLIGKTYYDGRFEPDQYFVIVKIKEVK